MQRTSACEIEPKHRPPKTRASARQRAIAVAALTKANFQDANGQGCRAGPKERVHAARTCRRNSSQGLTKFLAQSHIAW